MSENKNVNNINNNSDIDDIVNIIDKFISSDGGHINVHFDENSTTSFSKSKSNDCLPNMACSTPTLFEGIDYSDN